MTGSGWLAATASDLLLKMALAATASTVTSIVSSSCTDRIMGQAKKKIKSIPKLCLPMQF